MLWGILVTWATGDPRKYLTIILRNRAEYRLILSRRGRVGLNQAIFLKIEQDNCFIIQHIDNKAQELQQKSWRGSLFVKKKKKREKLVTFFRPRTGMNESGSFVQV